MIPVDASSSFFSEEITRTFLKKVHGTITEYGIIHPGDKVLVALSGGPDSVALLRTLLFLQSDLRIEQIGAAHLNHMLRKDQAAADQEFARNLANSHCIPFFTQNTNVKDLAASEKLSTEAAGRKARYEFFHHLALRHNFTKIATGHTQDDNAEQVLMAMIRGSGPKGMKGISPIREQNIIRPLIRMSKSRILEFLTRIHQDFVVDKSNTDQNFLRNRIRNHLIPLLEKDYNPNIRETLDRSAALFQEDEIFWEDLTKKTYSQCVSFSEASETNLHIPSLMELPCALMNRVLRKAICQVKGDLLRICLVHIKNVRKLISESASGSVLDLPGQIRVYKAGQTLTIKKENLPLRQLGRTTPTRT